MEKIKDWLSFRVNSSVCKYMWITNKKINNYARGLSLTRTISTIKQPRASLRRRMHDRCALDPAPIKQHLNGHVVSLFVVSGAVVAVCVLAVAVDEMAGGVVEIVHRPVAVFGAEDFGFGSDGGGVVVFAGGGWGRS